MCKYSFIKVIIEKSKSNLSRQTKLSNKWSSIIVFRSKIRSVTVNMCAVFYVGEGVCVTGGGGVETWPLPPQDL